MITNDEIKAADVIITYASMSETNADIVSNLSGGNLKAVLNAAQYLKEDGFIEILQASTWPEWYKATAKGINLQKSGRKYVDYLAEKSAEAKKRSERDALDLKHKILQIEDLETKLEIINKEQLKFWHRQRWQFWLTIMVAGAAFILSVINFIKSLVIR